MATTKTKSAPKSSAATNSKSESKEKSETKAKSGSKADGSKSTSSKSKSLTTTNHDEIVAWAEKRGGSPATVKGTDGKDNAGILRIDFPGYSGKDTLEPISWEDFFQKFDESNLQFLYQEKTAAGKESRFNKFVARD